MINIIITYCRFEDSSFKHRIMKTEYKAKIRHSIFLFQKKKLHFIYLSNGDCGKDENIRVCKTLSGP